jgi:uncharacterized protein (DUF169 family)
MDLHLKEKLTTLWEKYFPGAELPITFYYTHDTGSVPLAGKPGGHRCIIADFLKVRKGQPLAFNSTNIGCGGGLKYAGYKTTQGPNFDYFLSCGKEGVVEGERYKKNPQLVRKMMDGFPEIHANGHSMIFKRWDQLEEHDHPEVVIVFAQPDVLSGLFMLANYDRAGNNNVVTPMGSGCSQTMLYPYLEKEKKEQKKNTVISKIQIPIAGIWIFF